MLGRDRAQRYADQRKRRARGAFFPTQIAGVKRWYRLAASTPVSSEYETVEEVLGGTDISQTDADRKPAAATSANSLPVATFDGTDVWLQTLESGNNATAKWWMAFRIKPADFGASQQVYAAMTAAGASVQRMRMNLSNTTGVPTISIFTSGFNGRVYTAGTALTAAAWNHLYVQWDNTKTAECDTDGATSDAKLRLFLGTTALALTAANEGTGGTPAALLSATGTVTLCAANDADSPVSPLRNGGQVGPNWFFGDEPLTAAQLALIVGFEAPT